MTPHPLQQNCIIVCFGEDRAQIQSGDKEKLNAIAQQMKSKPSLRLTIEGHSDERATAAYNRALAEKRAKLLRDELVKLGVESTRISTLSYGKEKPAGNDATQNRRCELIFSDEKN
jgi:peptidoglycan-associated lipoprotein